MTDSKWLANVLATVLAFGTVGCTAQLSSNTLDMQASYKGLLTKQILYNLGQAEDDLQFFPSQFLIGAGTAQTNNTITPSVNIPLPASTITTAVATAAAPTFTKTSAAALGNATIGMTLADGWQFTWGVTPRTDPDELRRLRALYLYAVGKPQGTCARNLPQPRAEVSQKKVPTQADLDQAEACFKEQYVMQGGKASVNLAFTDEPGCVLCGRQPKQADLYMNETLKRLFGFITTSPSPADGFTLYDQYGFTKFYVKGGPEAFNDFVLFVLEAMSTTQAIPYTYVPPQRGRWWS
jgi:hypothetical protein